jgi:hypothetical protein
MAQVKQNNDNAGGGREALDFQRFYNESEAMFLAGGKLPEIAKQYGVSLDRLKEWHKKYFWAKKLSATLESPKSIGAMLRENLRKQTQALVGKGDLKVTDVEEIAKITSCIQKIEGCGVNVLAVTMEVLMGFSAFIRKNIPDRDQYQLVSSWVQEYLRSLADV